MWDKKIHHFNKVKAKEKLSHVFTYVGALSIKKIEPGCGCTKARFDGEKLHVTFTPDNVPSILTDKGMNYYRASQSIKVVYSNGEEDRLYLKADVYDKI